MTIMDRPTYVISFDEVSPADASRYADELSNALLDASADITIRLRRDDPRAQDFGATLVLLLGTPAAVALTKTITNVIESWLRLHHNASITIKRDDEQIIVRNITSKQAAKLAQVFLPEP
jgi:hypothetical protein